MRVALTGSAASGKSTVARIWAREGIPVIGADDLARRVVRPGTEGLRAVVEAFGSEVLTPEGELDRERMRERIFRDPEARRRLEGILHPRIRALRDAWLEEQRRAGASLVVAEIPLLFETGGEGEYDVTVYVDAPVEECLRRLQEDRGLDAGTARGILDAQMDPRLKRERADLVLDNSGGLEDLEERALALLDLLRARAARGRREGPGEGSS